MRLITMVISAIIILCSCNNSSSTRDINDTTATGKSEPVAPILDRPTLIGELKKLKEIISTKDKSKIATIFDFPIADSTASIYTEDESYIKEWRANGERTTRDMFNRYFQQVYEGLQMDEINTLFKQIQLDSLQMKDTLEDEIFIDSLPCYKSYSIEIDKEIVSLKIVGNSNPDFKSSNTKEDEVAENSSEMCEHAFWWNFKYDGKKLHLFQISGAD